MGPPLAHPYYPNPLMTGIPYAHPSMFQYHSMISNIMNHEKDRKNKNE